jgi:purine-binding chemotaxis protein CheW
MTTPYLIASVAGHCIAFDAASIDAIIRIDAIYPVPCAPSHIAGLCAVRSSVMTVIDLAKTVGCDADNEAQHAIVVRHDGHRYALRVDHVADIETITARPQASDPSIGALWHAVAPAHIETSFGTALLPEIDRVIGGNAGGH